MGVCQHMKYIIALSGSRCVNVYSGHPVPMKRPGGGNNLLKRGIQIVLDCLVVDADFFSVRSGMRAEMIVFVQIDAPLHVLYEVFIVVQS